MVEELVREDELQEQIPVRRIVRIPQFTRVGIAFFRSETDHSC